MESLKARLLEKLAQSLAELQLKTEELSIASVDSSKEGSIPGTAPAAAHEVSCDNVASFSSLKFSRWDVKIRIPYPSLPKRKRKMNLTVMGIE